MDMRFKNRDELSHPNQANFELDGYVEVRLLAMNEPFNAARRNEQPAICLIIDAEGSGRLFGPSSTLPTA